MDSISGLGSDPVLSPAPPPPDSQREPQAEEPEAPPQQEGSATEVDTYA